MISLQTDRERTHSRNHYSKALTAILIVAVFLTLAVTAAIPIIPVSANPAELHVGPGQTYSTIQAAIDAASPDDVINVHEDTYTKKIVVNVEGLTIQSVGDAENTIIDADGGLSGYPEDPDIPVKITANNVILDGFTITGAYCGLTFDMHSGVDLAAVGVYIDGVTGCTVQNCIFKDNDVPGTPGLYSDGYTYLIFLADDSDSNYIKNNVMTDNGLSSKEHGDDASRGHAILLDSHCDNWEITDNEICGNEFGSISLGTRMQGNYNNFNLISGNTILGNDGTGILLFIGNDDNEILSNTIQDNTGAGIRLYYGSNDRNLIKNNLITGNDDDGIFIINFSPNTCTGNEVIGNTITSNLNGIWLSRNDIDMVIKNNIIVSNTEKGIDCGSSTPSISYSDVWGNTGGDYSGCSAGTGCISSDPLFVTGPDGDYYLSQTAAGQASNSPCVDVGDPATSLYGTTRTDRVADSGVIDMGYHYGLPSNDPPNAPSTPLCEGEENPSDLLVSKPHFSWTFSDPDDGDTQSAYQIIVGSTEGGNDLWDSGKVSSSSSTVEYAGSPLSHGQIYHWKVKTWDSHAVEGTYCVDQTFSLHDKLEDGKSEIVDGSGTVDATDEADISVDIDATAGTDHTVTCAEYTDNPDSAFSNEIGKYYDVKIDDATNVNSLTLRFYYTDAEIAGRVESSLTMKYWDKATSTWKLCSLQTLHTEAVNGYSGYIEVTIDTTTEPTLNYLATDPPFGPAGNPTPPKPVGGEVFPVDKLALLAPYIAAILAIATGVAVIKRRRF